MCLIYISSIVSYTFGLENLSKLRINLLFLYRGMTGSMGWLVNVTGMCVNGVLMMKFARVLLMVNVRVRGSVFA